MQSFMSGQISIFDVAITPSQQPESSEQPEDYSPEDWAKFYEYHEQHPQVWEAFSAECFKLRAAGVNRCGAKGIMEDLRRDFQLQWDSTSSSAFKINNTLTSMYARYMVQEHPEFKTFFKFRPVRGISKVE